jgi:hypothetical protein
MCRELPVAKSFAPVRLQAKSGQLQFLYLLLKEKA